MLFCDLTNRAQYHIFWEMPYIGMLRHNLLDHAVPRGSRDAVVLLGSLYELSLNFLDLLATGESQVGCLGGVDLRQRIVLLAVFLFGAFAKVLERRLHPLVVFFDECEFALAG